MSINIRADKFLWCVRQYKTRTLSNEACNKSKVKINGNKIKPSHLVKIDDIIEIKKKIINIKIKVKDLLTNRTSPKLVDNYIEDITPESEKIKLEISKNLPRAYREKGAGRPTKKERRDMMKDLDDYSNS